MLRIKCHHSCKVNLQEPWQKKTFFSTPEKSGLQRRILSACWRRIRKPSKLICKLCQVGNTGIMTVVLNQYSRPAPSMGKIECILQPLASSGKRVFPFTHHTLLDIMQCHCRCRLVLATAPSSTQRLAYISNAVANEYPVLSERDYALLNARQQCTSLIAGSIGDAWEIHKGGASNGQWSINASLSHNPTYRARSCPGLAEITTRQVWSVQGRTIRWSNDVEIKWISALI